MLVQSSRRWPIMLIIAYDCFKRLSYLCDYLSWSFDPTPRETLMSDWLLQFLKREERYGSVIERFSFIASSLPRFRPESQL